MHHTNSPEGKSVIDILGTFISTNRDEIIARAEAHARARSNVPTTHLAHETEFSHANPAFLDQLADALQRGDSGNGIDRAPLTSTAAKHGHQLLRMGVPLAQVVHDYGDVCQAITDLAVEQEAWIPAASFRALNLCLDDAIAEAVTEYSRHREHAIEAQGIEKLGILVHEMRNLLGLATLSFESIRTSGPAAQEGRSGIVCARSLMDLSSLIDRSLADVRLDAGVQHIESISIAEFLEEIELDASIYAQNRNLLFSVSSVEPTAEMEGDRQILAAAVRNLLHNAFKFTPKHQNVLLRTRVVDGHVLFEVEDRCGGLPPGKIDDLFRPFEQRNNDRSGIGLGLVMCRKAAEAHHGEIRGRDLPGKGCIFTLELPLKSGRQLEG